MRSISDICLTTAFTRHRHSLRRCLYLRHIRRKILSRRAGLFQKDHKDEYTVIEYQPQNGACIASRQIRIDSEQTKDILKQLTEPDGPAGECRNRRSGADFNLQPHGALLQRNTGKSEFYQNAACSFSGGGH